jgi:hypothetical protein
MRVAAIVLFSVIVLPAFAEPVMSPRITTDHPLVQRFLNVQSYDCSRKTCSQIRSCDEACHKLMVCGHRRRDGDGDGIPCENLCSRRC